MDEVIPGLGKNSVDLLVAIGSLKAGMEFSPEARLEVQVVTRESAEAFAAKFVALGELCRSSGLHHKRVRQMLREQKVTEAFAYGSAGAFLYLRDAVAELMGRQ